MPEKGSDVSTAANSARPRCTSTQATLELADPVCRRTAQWLYSFSDCCDVTEIALERDLHIYHVIRQ